MPADAKNPAAAASQLPVYYYNTALRTSQWEHPSLTHWRSVLAELLQYEKYHMSDQQPPTRDASTSPMLWVTADAGLLAEDAK